MHTLTYPEPPSVLKLIAHEVRWKLLSALALSDYSVHELGELLTKPLNLVSYHLGLLRKGLIVHERRSSADARDVYYSLDLAHFQQLYMNAAESLHPALAQNQPGTHEDTTASNRRPTRILFLCTHNSARSQIAEALMRHLGKGRVEVFSAGTEASRVHPQALEVLQRGHVDTSGLYSKHLDIFLGQDFDYVITVCDKAKESCPVFPGHPRRIHWSFPDPSAVTDPEAQSRAFHETYAGLWNRIQLLLALIERDERDQKKA